MKEFLYVFRLDLVSQEPGPSPEQRQALWKAWQDWLGGLSAQNKLAATGKRLGTDGKVVKANGLVTNGPFVELKESVVGYMFVNAASLDEAAALAKTCPNITMGGTVEVRPVVSESGNG